MFIATVNGKTFDGTAIKLIELEQANEVLALFKSGKDLKSIFTEERIDESDSLMKKWLAESGDKFISTAVHCTTTGMTGEEFLKELGWLSQDRSSIHYGGTEGRWKCLN